MVQSSPGVNPKPRVGPILDPTGGVRGSDGGVTVIGSCSFGP